jgi:hypothetical protein
MSVHCEEATNVVLSPVLRANAGAREEWVGSVVLVHVVQVDGGAE